jgi:cytochrome c-type biogenesis protein CcmE
LTEIPCFSLHKDAVFIAKQVAVTYDKNFSREEIKGLMQEILKGHTEMQKAIQAPRRAAQTR